MIILVSCEKEDEYNTYIYLELVSSETIEIQNSEFQIEVYGYDPTYQDIPATLIIQHKFYSSELPVAFKMGIPENAAELIEYISDENNAKFYININWDSDNNGAICNGDIFIDYSNNFQNIYIDTTGVQTINLVTIKSIRCELESYIKNLILPNIPNPYDGEYYIHADFTNIATSERKELFFNASDHQLASVYSDGIGVSGRGKSLTDKSTNEVLKISFYIKDEAHETFDYRYANYHYANPWNNIAGASIEYITPDPNLEPDSRYRYLGSSGSEYYFEIRYMDNYRINGVFKTKWEECCGGNNIYDVIGDFSIPRI